MHRLGLDVPEREELSVLEEMVELAAVAFHVGRVEHGAEDLLHLADLLADPDTSAGLELDVSRARQMVGMVVGLEHPIDREPERLCLGKNGVGRLGRGLAAWS